MSAGQIDRRCRRAAYTTACPSAAIAALGGARTVQRRRVRGVRGVVECLAGCRCATSATGRSTAVTTRTTPRGLVEAHGTAIGNTTDRIRQRAAAAGTAARSVVAAPALPAGLVHRHVRIARMSRSRRGGPNHRAARSARKAGTASHAAGSAGRGCVRICSAGGVRRSRGGRCRTAIAPVRALTIDRAASAGSAGGAARSSCRVCCRGNRS